MEDYQVVAAILTVALCSTNAQLHVDWPRISGEMYGATTTSF
jgi:hypothetical protein